jgi:hypothetical protein
VLAVVLADRLIAEGGICYRDLALQEFGRMTKQRFEIDNASIPERDAGMPQRLARIKAR